MRGRRRNREEFEAREFLNIHFGTPGSAYIVVRKNPNHKDSLIDRVIRDEVVPWLEQNNVANINYNYGNMRHSINVFKQGDVLQVYDGTPEVWKTPLSQGPKIVQRIQQAVNATSVRHNLDGNLDRGGSFDPVEEVLESVLRKYHENGGFCADYAQTHFDKLKGTPKYAL